jgi:predicted MFS family arabinose efflux permease
VPWTSVSLPKVRSSGRNPLRVLLERRFLLASLLVVVYFVVYTLVTNFLQYYSIALFHGTVDQAGYVIGGARAAALVAGLVLGALVDRWGTSRAAPAGFLLLAAGALGTWAAHDYAQMVGATVVFAAGAGWLSVTLLPMALARVVPEDQGTAVGVFGSFEDLGLILGPLLFGVVYSALGPWNLFPVATALAVLALLIALAFRASTPAPSLSPRLG